MNLNEIVSGKRVCLTGSSKSIERNPPGFIDSFDVVLRVNQSWVSPTELRANTGDKIDVVYIPGKEGLEIIELFKHLTTLQLKTGFDYHRIKYIKHECENQEVINMMNNHNIANTDDLELKIWRFQNAIDMQKRPSCGLFAAWDLLRTDLTQLYITGISFYKEAYKKGHMWTHMGDDVEVHRINPHHDSIADELYFCSILYPDNSDRILLDSTLQSIYRFGEAGGYC